jgi:hypothetical protein
MWDENFDILFVHNDKLRDLCRSPHVDRRAEIGDYSGIDM